MDGSHIALHGMIEVDEIVEELASRFGSHVTLLRGPVKFLAVLEGHNAIEVSEISRP